MSSSDKQLQLTENNPYTRLTIGQKRYVEARLQGLTIQAAEKAAGISKTSNLDKNPKVRAAIRYVIKESTQNVEELTKSDVMRGMLDAVNAAATASELVMAWREMGKLIGAYEPERKILEIHDYTKDDMKTLSEDELLRLAGGRMRDAVTTEGEYVNVTPGTRPEPEPEPEL